MNVEESVILIVDDDPGNLNVLLDFFNHTDFDLLFAKDGTNAFKIAVEKLPDLILLDILMPEISGFEVCRSLKQNAKTKDIPVIFMTALTDVTDKIWGFELGAVDYITKPFDSNEVLARVKTHCLNKQLQNELKLKNELLKNQNQELEEALYLRESLSNMIVHDLRNPLACISLCCQIMKSNSSKPAIIENNIARILKQANHLNSFTNDLLKLAKIKSGVTRVFFL